jgi:hypothetical protein
MALIAQKVWFLYLKSMGIRFLLPVLALPALTGLWVSAISPCTGRFDDPCHIAGLFRFFFPVCG